MSLQVQFPVFSLQFPIFFPSISSASPSSTLPQSSLLLLPTELPRFTDKPSSTISTIAGNVVRIPCSAVGTPTPQPALRKFGVIDFPAARDRRLSIYDGDTCFTIANVQQRDAGRYVCESENAAGKVDFHFTLEVNEIPSFKKQPTEKVEFRVGQSAVLSCLANGWPFPSVTWRRNGRPLTLSNATQLHTAERGQLLLFLKVRPSDAGEYECTLLNVVGRDTATAVVDVRTADGLVYSGAQSRQRERKRRGGGRLTGHMTGVVVIAVVVCVVATSLAWVAALYCFRWRKRRAQTLLSGGGRRPDIFTTSRAGLQDDVMASYLLEKHRMLRRDATRAYDESERVEGAQTSDYNTGSSSECSAHSLSAVSGHVEPVTASSPMLASASSYPVTRDTSVTSFIVHETADEYV